MSNFTYNYSTANFEECTSSSHSARPLGSNSTIKMNVSLYKEPELVDCKRCTKYIYPLELMGPVMGYRYHKQCFRCHVCDRLLDFKSYHTNMNNLQDRQIYCVNHYPKNGSPYNSVVFNRSHTQSGFDDNVSIYRNRSQENLDDLTSRAVPLNIRPIINSNSTSRLNDNDNKISNIHVNIINDAKYDHESLNLNDSSINKHIIKNIEENSSRVVEKHTKEMSHFEQKQSSIEASSIKNNSEFFSESHESHAKSHSESHSSTIISNNSSVPFGVPVLPRPNSNQDRLSSFGYDRSSSYDNYNTNDRYSNSMIDKHRNHSVDSYPDYDYYHQNESFDRYSNESNANLKNVVSEIINHDKFYKPTVNEYQRHSSSSESNSNLKNIMNDIVSHDNKISSSSYNEQAYKPARDTNQEITFHLKNIVNDMILEEKLNNSQTHIRTNSNAELNKMATKSEVYDAISSYNQNRSQNNPHLYDIVLEAKENEKRKANSAQISSINNSAQTNSNSSASNQASSSSYNIHSSSYIHSSTSSSQHHTSITEQIIIPGAIGTGGSSTIVLPSSNINHPNNSAINNLPVNYQPTNPSNNNNSKYEFTNLNPNSKHPYLNSIIADILSGTNTGSKNTPSKNPIINVPFKPNDSRPIEINASEQMKIIGDDRGLGAIRITVFYDDLRTRLSITIHEARNLRNLEKGGLSDPYARIYLTPDEKPSLKRKTKILKNNLNPIWQETFDYSMTYNDAIKKELTVNLKDERGLFEKQESKFLGEIILKLKSIDLKQSFTRWFYLQPINTPLNYKFEFGN